MLRDAAKFLAYEVDGDELVKDLASFALANAVFHALVEGHATEISARRNGPSGLWFFCLFALTSNEAMDNASTNAEDVTNRLTMLYNRSRQAIITNDLVDIVTGASKPDPSLYARADSISMAGANARSSRLLLLPCALLIPLSTEG